MFWSGLAPELVWGLIPRFVGLLYIFAFGALIGQHDVMPGVASHWPARELFQRIRRDMPGVARFLRFPTLLWLNSSETTMKVMPFIGTACGVWAVYGGPFAWYALVVAWMLWVSLECRGLLFPWDTMLQEVGFLSLFLPAVQALPSFYASALPLPSVAFMVRWLVVRLMWGFGKEKFLGATRSDLLYLRGFFVWMPLPTPLGWLAHRLPARVLRGMLGFMFIAEIVAPLGGLFAGPTRVVTFALMSLLMLGIQLTGNWGFFNIAYILLGVSLLDTQATLFDLAREPWVGRLTQWPDLGVHLLMALMFPVTWFYVPNNSWTSRTWLHWPPDIAAVPHSWIPRIKRIQRALSPLRWIEPFRLVSGYGVFPPQAMAPIRLMPVFEGSDDGVVWKQYGYKYMPTFPNSRPPVIAPYHARLDQYLYYTTVGIDPSSLYGSLFPMANPYASNMRVFALDLMIQRILNNEKPFLAHLGHNPFPDRAPRMVRVGILGLTPTRLSELRATGNWWHTRRFGTLVPARTRDGWYARNWIPEPELFHPDLLGWKNLTRPLRVLVQAYESGMPLERAVIEGSDLTDADVAELWQSLVPMLAEARGDMSQLHARYGSISARFAPEQLLRLERVLERYSWLLRKRTEQHRFGQHPISLPPMSNYRFHLLLQEVVLDGRQACEAMLREPSRIVERAQRSTDATQIWATALLRYEQVMAHISTFHASEMGLQSRKAEMPGFFEYYDLLMALTPPGEQFHPTIVKHANGEHTVEGFYPPPVPGDSSGRNTPGLAPEPTP